MTFARKLHMSIIAAVDVNEFEHVEPQSSEALVSSIQRRKSRFYSSMAKKQQKKEEKVENEPEDHSDEEEDAELDLLQVDLGDMVKMKQVLDESVSAAILAHVDEDYSWDNMKLAIMFAACCSAMVAQFAPVPFPESRPILGVCGSLYFVLSGVLQFITTFMDKDAILLTKPDDKKKRKNDKMKEYGLRVRSDFPRFSEWYTVIIEFQLEKGKDMTASPAVIQKWSVGKFFDKEGYFDEIGLTKEVDKLLARFEANRFDDLSKLTKAD